MELRDAEIVKPAEGRFAELLARKTEDLPGQRLKAAALVSAPYL